jgi:preprotein translocase subunit YajC
VSGLQKGDKVVTRAGLHGRVHQVDEATIILEIADKVQVTIDKMSVTRKGDA